MNCKNHNVESAMIQLHQLLEIYTLIATINVRKLSHFGKIETSYKNEEKFLSTDVSVVNL